MTKSIFVFLLNVLCVEMLFSQTTLITNVTVHVGNGSVLQNQSIEIQHGKIVKIVSMDLIKPETFSGKTEIIDGKGKHAYPGAIAPATKLGLEEVEAVRATLDYAETGDVNPNVRTIVAYNTDSDILPTVRSNGILLAQVAPQGGLISGQSSIVSLESNDNWEERGYKIDDGLWLNWPARQQTTGWWAEPGETKKADGYSEKLKQIKTYFAEARAYISAAEHTDANLKFESFRKLLNGEARLFVNVDEARSILDVIQFGKDQKIKIVIYGGRDSWKVATELHDSKIPVILFQPNSLPYRNDDDYDQSYKTASQLKRAGVLYCLSVEGSWQNRNLPFQAGQTVNQDLDKESALASITKNTAEILGIADRTGTLEAGKDATLVLSIGDLLDIRTSNVTDAWSAGKKINLDDKQKALFRQYQTKYNIK